MSVKGIDPALIPGANSKGKPTQRDLLRADFAEAIASNVNTFELVGEGYNYKYLAQYAHDEARHVWRNVESDIYSRIKNELVKADPTATPEMIAQAVRQARFDDHKSSAENYIKVISRNFENRVHVYFTIDRQYPEKVFTTIYDSAVFFLKGIKEKGANK